MPRGLSHSIVVLSALCTCALALKSAGAAERQPVDFSREIRPILAKKCFACHGPDDEQRQAGLRLDQRDGAVAKLESGAVAIVPGKRDESELIRRITAAAESERMPPADTGITLEPPQIELLKRWVEEGASFAPHWAFVKPVRPALPPLDPAGWSKSGLDQIVLAGLKRHGLAPSPRADKYTLIRRASLDLRGLPPTPEEVELFISDQDTGAYERLLDRLLADPAYGERWARMWLDQARYADSRGYGSDPLRPTAWRYRDWVIDAFNANKPYDQFTIEQIAGDLLPGATLDQKVATAFHRNTMTNTEGGTDDEEFRVAAVKDRVDTTLQVWMGLTMGCAKCHNHKFDPIAQKEYYQFFAIFNQTADTDQPDDAPLIDAPTPEFETAVRLIDAQIAPLTQQLETDTPQVAAERAQWEESFRVDSQWQPLEFAEMKSAASATLTRQPDGSILAGGERGATDTYTLAAKTDMQGITAFRLEAIPDESLPGKGSGRADNGNFVLSQFSVTAQDAEKMSSPSVGRFVRIELPGKEKYLHLAEVQAFSGGENVAIKGTATQSSVDFGGEPRLGIDGNTDGDYYGAKSTFHTRQEDNPWWEVDLGDDKPIERLAVWNRTDGGTADRLSGYRIQLLDGKRQVVWQNEPLGIPSPSSEFSPSGIVAVKLSQAAADHSQHDFPVESAIKPGNLDKTGWSVGPRLTEPHEALFVAAQPLAVGKQTLLTFTLDQKFHMPGHTLGRFRLSITSDKNVLNRLKVPAEILAIVDTPADKRMPEQAAKLVVHYRSIAPLLKSLRDQIAKLEKSKPAMPKISVMQELAGDKRRANYVMLKGNFLVKGESVEPALPSAFHGLPPDMALDRLAVARWLVHEDNPLSARVAVNRFWAQLFGSGIVETEEDFGIQGELPSNQELLDWLAVEFIDLKWDVKALLKTIMLSEMYCQSSRLTPEVLEKDPRNRLYSRGPRFRLEAEMVRDQALALSGLLSRKLKGPSVYPPQPEGLWQAAFNGERTWPTSKGEDRYRRGLYTFWRRTIPYPSMATFDAPSREVCALRRIRTNTPLQAFVTMNDPVYVEASQALARRIIREGGGTTQERAAWVLRLCLARPAAQPQIDAIVALYESELAHYKADAAAAEKLTTDPLGKLPDGMDAAEAAAWTVVANVLLNMDGVLMKG
jgi:mono/diheme cytochrome c family protein